MGPSGASGSTTRYGGPVAIGSIPVVSAPASTTASDTGPPRADLVAGSLCRIIYVTPYP